MEEDPTVGIQVIDFNDELNVKAVKKPQADEVSNPDEVLVDIRGLEEPKSPQDHEVPADNDSVSTEPPSEVDVPNMIGGTSSLDYHILGIDDQEDLHETLPADENDDSSVSIAPPSEVETVDQLPKVVLNLSGEDKEKPAIPVFRTMLENLKKAKQESDFMIYTGHIDDPVHVFTAIKVNLELEEITEDEADKLTEKCKEMWEKLKLKKRLIKKHLNASQDRDHVIQSMGLVPDKTTYELCLENLEAFANNLSTEHLENIFNACKDNADERAILYSVWIKTFLENGNDDQIFGNLHMVLEATPDFKKDLPMIVDLLPNLNKKAKEKMLHELGLMDMEEEVENVPECTPEEIKEIENNFFIEGDKIDRKITQLKEKDRKNEDKPFYINEFEINSQEENNNEEDVKSKDDNKNIDKDSNTDTPEKTQSRLRNSLLAAAGLLAAIGIGYTAFNNLEQNNNTRENSALSSTNSGSEGSASTPGEKETPPSETPAIAANPEDATTAQEEPDAAAQEEPDATTQDADKEDKAPAIANADRPAIPKIPFLKEKSMEMPVSTKVTRYGDTVVDFDTSLENWEENGWEKLEAFHHSPTKQGWILRKDETIVFVLQQLLELDQTKILAYIQPKTW